MPWRADFFFFRPDTRNGFKGWLTTSWRSVWKDFVNFFSLRRVWAFRGLSTPVWRLRFRFWCYRKLNDNCFPTVWWTYHWHWWDMVLCVILFLGSSKWLSVEVSRQFKTYCKIVAVLFELRGLLISLNSLVCCVLTVNFLDLVGPCPLIIVSVRRFLHSVI